jgi:hypothetical protein
MEAQNNRKSVQISVETHGELEKLAQLNGVTIGEMVKMAANAYREALPKTAADALRAMEVLRNSD